MSDLTIRVDFACNDPDNGDFAGRAAGITVGSALELAAHDMAGPRFSVEPGRLRISRRRFRFMHSKDWHGNWCWNAYWLDIPNAVYLLNYVHSHCRFSVDMGVEPLFDLWKSEQPWTLTEIYQVRLALVAEARS